MERLRGIRQKINVSFGRIKESFRVEPLPSKEELIAVFPHDPSCNDRSTFQEFERYVNLAPGGSWVGGIGYNATFLKCVSCDVVEQYYQRPENTE